MKITFILPPVDLSGGNRVVSIYAKLLHEMGHDVTLVSIPHPKPSWLDRIRSSFKMKKFNFTMKIPPSHFDGLSLKHIILNKNRPIISKDVPDSDIIIATWWETAEWVHRLPAEKGAHVYFIQHHEVFEYLPIDRVKATWRYPMHKIVIAEWLRTLAFSDYSDPDVDLVPNAVDTSQFFAPLRQKQKIPTIGMLYAPMLWKGTDVALKAISIARLTYPDLKVVALGIHSETPDFQLPKDAYYAKSPAQENIREIYAQCDAWLFASRSEGFGLPIIEAMACRTPVIGVPVGAAPELLTNNAGILVEPENAEAMANAIIEICSLSENEWQKLSNKAFDRVQSYTWNHASKLFENSLFRAVNKYKIH